MTGVAEGKPYTEGCECESFEFRCMDCGIPVNYIIQNGKPIPLYLDCPSCGGYACHRGVNHN